MWSNGRYVKIHIQLKNFSGVTLLKITPGVTLSNITPLNNLLLNSYFENPTVELHVLYVLNIHATRCNLPFDP